MYPCDFLFYEISALKETRFETVEAMPSKTGIMFIKYKDFIALLRFVVTFSYCVYLSTIIHNLAESEVIEISLCRILSKIGHLL